MNRLVNHREADTENLTKKLNYVAPALASTAVLSRRVVFLRLHVWGGRGEESSIPLKTAAGEAILAPASYFD